jgi:replicative DNA helicase
MTEPSRQLTPVAPLPGNEDLLIGALLYSTTPEVCAVTRFIDGDDLEQPASTVLAAIKALAGRGVPPSPQLVSDDLHRRGKLTRTTATWLANAATSGACASAASAYAAAVLATSFRRRAESFGTALVPTAESASEKEVAGLAEQAAKRVLYVYGRLTELRGESE